MESYHAHQLILPTDKRNPCFSLYASEDERFIHVFYGLELFEVVPDDHEHMGFKMMVGRLYNAGVKVTTLEDTFNLDRKTIGSWGRAMRSRDPEVLQQVLLGRGASQKRTPAIDRYVVRRRSELLDEGCPEYRATLIREIETIFEVRLSGETIRKIVGGMKGLEAPTSEHFERPGDPGINPIIPFSGETTCSPTAISTMGYLPENPPQPSCQAASGEIPPPPAAPSPSKSSPPCWNPLTGDAQLCDHLGMLVFASALTTISQATNPPEPLLAQWLGSVLLGARNIEQTKYLNWEDLGTILGQTVRFPTTQRDELTRLATPATIDAVLRWNHQQLNLPDADGDLYYDPHTAHYTGTQNILKGWCASIRWADKLINSDYIHTAQGHPIYFECTDSFDDLRGRFFPLIERLRASLQWSPQRVLTFIVDRGIYSNDVFNQVLADPNIHFITWEKVISPTTKPRGKPLLPSIARPAPIAPTASAAAATTPATNVPITLNISTAPGPKTPPFAKSLLEPPTPGAEPSNSPSSPMTPAARPSPSCVSCSTAGSRKTISNTSTNTSASTNSPATAPPPTSNCAAN
jgi:hypothetical protein